MPLYDCMLLLKPHIKKEAMMELAVRIGKHVQRKNGVLTDMKSFGTVQLGYGIKKLDGRYFQGQLLQMTMMATPKLNEELHYLNKEDRLLRWLLVKHRDIKSARDFERGDDDWKDVDIDDNGDPADYIVEVSDIEEVDADNSDDDEYALEEGERKD